MRYTMRSSVLLAVLSGTILVGPEMGSSFGQSGDAAEKSFPASTVGFLKIENAAKLREAFQASQFGQLAEDPAVQPLKEDLLSRLEEPNKQLKERLGVTIRELITLPQGAINLAVVTREAAEGKPPVALFATADAGSNGEKMAEVMAKVNAEAEKNGAKVVSETFKGQKLSIISSDESTDPLVWTNEGSVYYISSDPAVLKDYLANKSGRTESLATNDNYQGVLKSLGENRQVSFFVDVAQVIKLAIASNPGGNAAQMEAQLELTGINGFKAMGGTFNFNQGDYDQVLKLFLYSPGPAQGILKILAMPPIDLKPQSWVPANANSYQSFSWDLDAAWKAITELADKNGVGGLIDQAENGIAGPNGDFSFQKDVFGPLGNRITTVSDFKKPITEQSRRYLFGIGLDDEKAFQSTFNKILDLTKASPKKRDFQGTTVYDFEIPEIPNAGAAGLTLQGPISVTIAKGNLFIASEPTFLEQILRSGGAALADSPEFQAVAKKYPAMTSILSYDKTEEQARLLYDMVKGDGLQKAIDQANANNPGEKVDNPIDPKKIPDFSVFAKYLAAGGTFGVQDENGVTITSFMLRKAKP